MDTWAVNKCAGRRWRALSDRSIEIEGEGVPVLNPTDPRFKQLAQTWANWGSLFRSSAANNGVPLSWLVAIATVETGAWSGDPKKQEAIVSPAGAAGVMQFMPATAQGYGFTPNDRFSAPRSIEMGGRFLRDLAKKYDGQLPLMAAAYNAGGAYCSPGRNEWNLRADANYPRQAILYNNTALRYLDFGPSSGTFILAGAVFAAAAAAGFLFVGK